MSKRQNDDELSSTNTASEGPSDGARAPLIIQKQTRKTKKPRVAFPEDPNGVSVGHLFLTPVDIDRIVGGKGLDFLQFWDKVLEYDETFILSLHTRYYLLIFIDI